MGVKNCRRLHSDSKLGLRKCYDYSISMINIETIKAYGFDKSRLMNDLEYAVECGAKILYDLKKMYGHEPDYWVRYNVGTRPRYKIPTIWKTYKTAVMRWL